MGYLRDRIHDIDQVRDAFSTQVVGSIKKDEKVRINKENYYLDLLYRFQKVDQNERQLVFQQLITRLAFVQNSCQILMCEMIPQNSTKGLYDFVAQIYLDFFIRKQLVEKAIKLKLIYTKEMHRNQSFLILLIKWSLEYYREELKKLLGRKTLVEQPSSRFIPNPLQLLENRTSQSQSYYVQSTKNQFKYLLARQNIEKTQKHSMQEGESINDLEKVHSLNNSIDRTQRMYQRFRLEKIPQQSIYKFPEKQLSQKLCEKVPPLRQSILVALPPNKEMVFRTKKEINLYRMQVCLKPVIQDVDWDYIKNWDLYKIQHMMAKNQNTNKTISDYLNNQHKI